MKTWTSYSDGELVGSSSEPDISTGHEAEVLAEPECWQLDDFEDIVPHDLRAFETEYDSAAAYCD